MGVPIAGRGSDRRRESRRSSGIGEVGLVAVMTEAELLAAIADRFPDNTSEEIILQDLREFLTDLIETLFDGV